MENQNNTLVTLKQYFGFEGFLDNQEDVINRILEGEDLCVIMPTGAGKSLCYQLPILMNPGYGIIVSPLISLMKDQVDALKAKGIPAEYVNSTVPQIEQQRIFRETAIGNVKLLYVAPERFHMNSFQHLIDHQPPQIMIIDEAHCISQWGHDFRPSYLHLGEVIENYNIPQICAFTATATSKVREDIKTQLRRENMQLLVAGFKRPNLSFSVINCRSKSQKNKAIAKLMRTPCPTIIYASTRKAVDEIAKEFDFIPYHAGMTDEDRHIAQEKFMNDSCPVLVATNAFGMGIDRPDVRRVVHYNITGSLEAYYQEAGRAGRDGEPAECILLFSYSDRFVQEFLIDLSNPSEELIKGLYSTLLDFAEKQNSDTLELTLADCAAFIPEAKSDNQLSSAMRILEKNGYLERGFSQQNAGKLRFIGDLETLNQQHSGQATQRSRFIYRCIKSFGEQLSEQIPCTYELLASVAGLNIDQIKRVLRALNGDCIEWIPPFAGRTTKLLRPNEKELDIDFDALVLKKEFEMERLDEVISYTNSPDCRQCFLISYFGENTRGWKCENCDICGKTAHTSLRNPGTKEKEIIKTILSTVMEFEGRFGRGRISQVLAGAKRPEIVNWGLDRHQKFGVLKHLSQNNILLFLKSLENSECIGRTGNPKYPCIDITIHGINVLDDRADVRLDFPEINTKSAEKKRPPTKKKVIHDDSCPNSDMDDFNIKNSDLFEKLRELRKDMARKGRTRPYRILTDAVLIELVKKTPVTPEEAIRIKGVGENKIRRIIPKFLDVIHAWRKELGREW